MALTPTGTAQHLCWILGTQQAAPVLGVCKEQKRGDAAATNPGVQRAGTAPPSLTPERRAAVSSISRQDTRDAGDGAQGQQPGRDERHACSQSSVGRTAGQAAPSWGLSEDQAKCRCIWARSCSRDALSVSGSGTAWRPNLATALTQDVSSDSLHHQEADISGTQEAAQLVCRPCVLFSKVLSTLPPFAHLLVGLQSFPR